MKYLKKAKIPIFLTVIFIAFSLLTTIWLRSGNIIIHWDMGRHLWNSMLYYNDIHDKANYPKSILYAWTTPYRFYPPFVYTVTTFVYILSHSTQITTAILSLLFFAAVLITFTYLFAREFVAKRNALIAVVFILTTPIVFTQFHEYMLDVPLLAMYVMTLYFLWSSDLFTHRIYSILCAISFGFALMTKWTFVLVISGPMVLLSIQTVFRIKKLWKQKNKKEIENIILNIITFIIIVALLSAGWYITNANALRADLTYNAISGKANPLKIGLQWLLYYFFTIENIQLYLGYTLITLVGFYLVHFKHKENGKYRQLLLSFIISYLVLTCINNKDPRYSIPLLIYPTIYAASMFSYIKQKKKYLVTLAVFLIFACVQVYFVSFFSTNPVYGKFISLGNFGAITLINNNGYTSGAPVKPKWDMTSLVQALHENNKNNYNETATYIQLDPTQKTAQISPAQEPYEQTEVYFIGDDSFQFNQWELRYLLIQKQSGLFLASTPLVSYTKGGYIMLHMYKAQANAFLKILPATSHILAHTTLPDTSVAFAIALPDKLTIRPQTCVPLAIQSAQCRIY